MNLNHKRIEQARLARDMSRGDLAFKIRTLSAGDLKVDAQHVRRWEKGLHEPSATAIACIAQALGHPIEFFYESGADDDEEEKAALQAALPFVSDVLLSRAMKTRVDELEKAAAR